MTVRVKICGVTRMQDAVWLRDHAVDCMGCVLVAGTPRAVQASWARELFAEAGPGVQGVAVFRAASASRVVEQAQEAGVGWVQLHGCSEEVACEAERHGLRVTRVRSVAPGAQRLEPMCPAASEHTPWLLDTGAGGTGQAFPWQLLGERAPAYTWIAGGIGVNNVARLLERAPYGIDVSSAVEQSAGVKDPAKMAQLLALCRGQRQEGSARTP